MKTKVKKFRIPNYSLVNTYELKIDYEDSFGICFDSSNPVDIDYFAKSIFTAMPDWALKLFKLRNFLVKFVGLDGGDIFEIIEKAKESDCRKGSLVGIFTIYDRNENEIMFVEKDKHLDFSGSILLMDRKEINDNTSELAFITRVQFNILLGNFYFFFVKPFHKLIVKSLLKRMVRNYYAGK